MATRGTSTRERPSTRERDARPTRVPVVMPEESRPAAWLRNFRLSGFALSLLLLIVAALVVLAPSLKTLVEQRQQIAELQTQVDQATSAVTDLKGEVDRWKDPAYVEAQARNRLYYVFPGDVSYLVMDQAATTPTANGQPISDQIQTTKVDWMRSLLSSVYTAGLTQSTPAQLSGTGTGTSAGTGPSTGTGG